MTPDLHQMTTVELKKYLSDNRNDDDAFSTALAVIMSRQDPNAPNYPAPTGFNDPRVKEIIESKLKATEEARAEEPN